MIERLAKLETFSRWPQTLVIFEAPHRLLACLTDLLAVLGDRELAVCRELTKLHEEVYRGSISQALEHFAAPRGEFVLVVRGQPSPAASPEPTEDNLEEARQQLAGLRGEGIRARDAVAQVAESLGLPKNAVYRLWLQEARQKHE